MVAKQATDLSTETPDGSYLFRISLQALDVFSWLFGLK